MFEFLRAIELYPIEWSKARELTGEASPYISKILDAALNAAQAIVVLFTPDEIVRLRPEYADGVSDPEVSSGTQARPNVLFEAGMAMGRNAERTVLVELGRMRPFSDILGHHALRISNDAGARHELASRLRTAGCDVNTSGQDWLSSGNFVIPSEPQLLPKVDRSGARPGDAVEPGSMIRRREIR